MDRIRGIVTIVTLASLGVSASEIVLSPATDAASTAVDATAQPSFPQMSPQQLRDAVQAWQKTTANAPVSQASRRPANQFGKLTVNRNPFIYSTQPKQERALPMELPLPVMRLMGIVGEGTSGVATIEINGKVMTLKGGETFDGVRLLSTHPPDKAEVQAGGRTAELRVM